MQWTRMKLATIRQLFELCVCFTQTVIEARDFSIHMHLSFVYLAQKMLRLCMERH